MNDAKSTPAQPTLSLAAIQAAEASRPQPALPVRTGLRAGGTSGKFKF